MEWILAAAALIIVLIIVAVLFLPYVIKAKLNAALSKMEGYTGRVEGLQINLFAARINVSSVRISKVGVAVIDPVLLIPEAIVYFRWRQLLKRSFDLKVLLQSPKMSVVDDGVVSATPVEAAEKPIEMAFKLKNAITTMMPFRINAEIRNAMVRYQKYEPSLDLTITHVNVTVVDFSNLPDQTTPCLIKVIGLVNEGTMNIVTQLHPLEPTLTFDLNMELNSINLVPFNDLIKAYGKVDINTGTLDFFAEIAVANNQFNGYLKPILTELDFIGVQDKNDSLLHKVWERIVAAGVQFLVNKREGQLATTIPIRGRLDDPQVNTGAAIAGLLRNAFLNALKPSLEDVVSPGKRPVPAKNEV